MMLRKAKKVTVGLSCICLVITMLSLAGCTTGQTAATTSEKEAVASETESAAAETTATKPEAGKSYVIGVAPNTLQPPWGEMVKAVDLRCAELSELYGIDYIQVVKAPEQHASLEEQSNIFDDFIAQGVNVIVGVTVDTDSYAGLAKRCADAGIPVGAIVQPTPVPSVSFYVNTDEIKAAEEAGERLAKDLNGKATVMFLHGQKIHPCDVNRYTGYMNAFKKYPGIKVLAENEAKWQAQDASVVMDDWIAGYGDQFDAVITANDNMAVGVIASMKSAGKKYYVTGWDGTEDGAKAIQAGDLAFSIDQDFSMFGKMVADAGFQVITTGMSRELWIVPHNLVDKSNIQAMLDRINNTLNGVKSWE